MSQSDKQNVEQLLDQTNKILDLRKQMATARAELAKSKMLLLLEPRGYGPRSEYRKACKSIMKNARAVKKAASALRKELEKMGINEDHLEIEQALKQAADATHELGFWGRLGL